MLFIGIALLSLVNACSAANVVDKQTNSFTSGILHQNNIYNGTQTFKLNHANQDLINLEGIENANKKVKTTDELIAEDNAITENNFSNETLPLDFAIINKYLINDEVIEYASLCKIEKTPEELIAEDNAITENNLSNETQALDFRIINRISNLVMDKNKSILGYGMKL